MALFPVVTQLSQLTALTRTDAPPASATKALLHLGAPLTAGNALGTVLGGEQASGYSGDWLNFRKNGKNRFRVTGAGAATLFDTDLNDTTLQVLGNVSGGVGVELKCDSSVANQGVMTLKGGIGDFIFGRGTGADLSYALLALNGGAGFIIRGKSVDCLKVQEGSAVDRFIIDITGKLLTNQAAAASGPVGAVVKKVPLYDVATRALLGYLPLYDAIS